MKKSKIIWMGVLGVSLVAWFIWNISGWQNMIKEVIAEGPKRIFWSQYMVRIVQTYPEIYGRAVVSVIISHLIMPIITLTGVWVLYNLIHDAFTYKFKLADILHNRERVVEAIKAYKESKEPANV